MDKSNLVNTISMTKFGGEVNIKSIQDEDESSKWAGALINSCSLDVGPFIKCFVIFTSSLALSIKITKTDSWKRIFLLISSRFSSNFL